MTAIILHHYPTSPYAEKVRVILGFKQLAWKSVFIPTVMPKPDLVALTGGYRKTPVLQIGCDIFCDTKLISRALDQLQPNPPLVPAGREASCAMTEQWSEQLFLLCAPIALQPQGLAHFFGKLPPDAAVTFQKDRAALFTSGSGKRTSMAVTRSELPGYLSQLETQLSVVPFLDGSVASLADISVYHPLWFLLSNPGIAEYLQPYPNIRAWAGRIAAFGHGKPEKMTSEEAIQIARNSQPIVPAGNSADPAGLKLGETITVAATDYGADPVSGVLVHSDLHEVVIQRSDERAGTLRVHFPRAGFKAAVPK